MRFPRKIFMSAPAVRIAAALILKANNQDDPRFDPLSVVEREMLVRILMTGSVNPGVRDRVIRLWRERGRSLLRDGLSNRKVKEGVEDELRAAVG